VAAKGTDPRTAIAEEYRARLMPKLDQLHRIGELAEQRSFFAGDWPADEVAPDVTQETGDAFVVMRDDLRDLGRRAGLELRCLALDFDPVRVALQMFELVREPHDYLDAPDPRFYRRHLDQLLRARYVLVVVTHEVRMPRPEGAAQFEAGRVGGAALLFEIEAAVLRGGFTYFAENRWAVAGRDATVGEKLVRDLRTRFAAEVVRGIGARFPAGRPPVTLGLS
jgi:hypothetical protein